MRVVTPGAVSTVNLVYLAGLLWGAFDPARGSATHFAFPVTEPPIDVDERAAGWRLDGTLIAISSGEVVG